MSYHILSKANRSASALRITGYGNGCFSSPMPAASGITDKMGCHIEMGLLPWKSGEITFKGPILWNFNFAWRFGAVNGVKRGHADHGY